MEFELGQNSLAVCKVILDHQPDISTIRLIEHEVGINWRQRYLTFPEKLEQMLAGFEHASPISIQGYSGEEFRKLSPVNLYTPKNQVWSITSKVAWVTFFLLKMIGLNLWPSS